MPNVLEVPTLPNRPLLRADEPEVIGRMQLRRNVALDFVENAAFLADLAVYDQDYQNSQAHSPLFLAHMQNVLALLKARFPRGSKLVEVGCGKGDFVELALADGHFDASGYDATYEGANPRIEKRYLGPDDRIQADVIVLRHVLEHIPAPHRFLAMLRDIFKTGHVYIEVPSHEWILTHQAFFDITYEHVNYFTRTALTGLFGSTASTHGLLFGDQYQYVLADISTVSQDYGSRYDDASQWQTLDFDSLFPSLSSRIAELDEMIAAPARLYLWGAATKGCMFLMHCRNQQRLLDKMAYVVDINPGKCGKFLPGSRIPIQAPEALYADAREGDVLVIANPNYQQEIAATLQAHGLSGLKITCL
ncbi:C-methyltransferase C-terminal domain [Bordetella ansorpii]|uniref:C-methyltransferase C-terminal domain n=1 Tax=Bordetella ansorpii TaxID=288768 RepID=A0A157SLM2_9BORD|nr:class I SAM-dependent methyltransferase [Bordetella ansorpii]SAI71327.1 C-methyltransferase C-terminal domain [Bordetella ansorpii]